MEKRKNGQENESCFFFPSKYSKLLYLPYSSQMHGRPERKHKETIK